MAQVLVTVPSRVLLEQFAEELPLFCKVGTGYNGQIDMESRGFIAVTDSVQLLQKLKFEAAFIDEAHHPVPKGMPSCKDVFKFSATHKEEADFRYSLGEAIEQGVLCDYDLTVPVTSEGHPYICLANLLLSQAGRFRRVLAYCNSIAEARRFRRVVKTVGLAAWHINGETSRKERERVMCQFSGELTKPAHVLVTVQVLGEGVNIPNADTCMFVEPRSSYVSIIQAIGRGLRLHPSKPLAHVVLPALAVLHSPAGALPLSAKSASLQVAASSEAQPNGIAEVSMLERPETDVGTEVPLRETLLGGLEPHVTEAAARQSRRNAPPAAPGMKTADGKDETSKIAGEEGVPAAGQNNREKTDSVADDIERQSAELEGSRVDWAGEPFLPAPKLGVDKGGNAVPRAAGNPTGVRPVVPVVPCSASERPPAIMPDFGTAPRRAAGAKSEQEWLLDGPPIQAVSKDQSQTGSSSAEAERRGHGNGSRIGTRRPGLNSRLRSRAASDVGFFGTSYSEQLARFLRAIARSDCRYAEKDTEYLQSRLWFTDCRLNKEVSMHPLVRSMQDQLALILQRRDPWDVRLKAVEQFAKEHGRLPRQKSTYPGESVLGVWLHNIGYLQKRQELAATRMQKLLNSPCRSLRARVAKWLEPSTAFEKRLGELQWFVQEHGRLPRWQSSVPREEVLNRWLGRVGYLLRKQTLPAAKIQKLLNSSSMISARAMQWLDSDTRATFEGRVEEVQRFVREHGRLPRRHSSMPGETVLGVWLGRVRGLHAKLQKLLNSSCSMIRARAAQWLGAGARTCFQRRVEELQHFVQLHGRMPQNAKASSVGERKLMKRLLQLVRPTQVSNTRMKRLQRLAQLGPVVASWTRSRQAQQPRVLFRPWVRKLNELIGFVNTNKRLPRQNPGETHLYSWLARQRRRLASLPPELRNPLTHSHPLVAAYLQIRV